MSDPMHSKDERENGHATVREFFKRTPIRPTREQLRAAFAAYMRDRQYRAMDGRVKTLRTMADNLGVTQTTVKRWLAKYPEVARVVATRNPRARGRL